MNEEDIYWALHQAFEQELQYLLLEEECDRVTVFAQAEKAIEELKDNFRVSEEEDEE